MILRLSVEDDTGRAADAKCREHFPYVLERRSMMNEPNAAREWCEERWGKRAGEIEIIRASGRAYAVIDTDKRWIETGEWFGFKTEDQAFEYKMRWYGVP